MSFDREPIRRQHPNTPQHSHILDALGRAIDDVRSLFGKPSNRRATPEELAKKHAARHAEKAPTRTAKPTRQPVVDQQTSATQGMTRRQAVLTLLAGGGALALGGGVILGMEDQKTPKAPHTPTAPTNPEVAPKIYPKPNALLNSAIESQEAILNTPAGSRTAYYLNTDLDIVHEAPFSIFVTNPKKPKLIPPANAIVVPPREKDQSAEDYARIKAEAIGEWHDNNRRAYSAQTGANINPHKDDPMVNVSPPEGSTFTDVWQRAQGHIDSVQKIFTNTFEKTDLYKEMSENARKEMTRVCTQGQVSNESQWNPNLTSTSDEPARGPWQIKTSTANDSLKKNKDKVTVAAGDDGYSLYNFKDATMIAVMYYEQVYKTLKPTLLKVKEKYQLDDETFYTNFVIPCLINAYHNGQGGMNKVVNWFLESYEKATVQEELGPDAKKYGSNLYFLMTQCYFVHGGDASFGKRSFQYVPKCYAYAKLVDVEKSQVAAD